MSAFCNAKYVERFLPLKLLVRLLKRNEWFSQFRTYQRSYNAYQRKLLDVGFLEMCRSQSVVPKFIRTFKLPNDLGEEERKKIYKKTLSNKINKEKATLSTIKNKLSKSRQELFNTCGYDLFLVCLKKIIKDTTKVLSVKRTNHERKFRALLQISKLDGFKVQGTIINKSDYQLKDKESNILKFGLKHGILTPVNQTNLKSKFEELYVDLCKKDMVDVNDASVKDNLRLIATRFINQNKHNPRKDEKILQNLRKENIKICKFDKGNGVVVLNNKDYNDKMKTILQTPMFQEVKLHKRSLPPASKTRNN